MAEFKNPNQGGGQDSRTFLVMIVVMFAVIFGLQYYKSQHAPQTGTPTAAPAAGAAAPASAPGQVAAVAAAPVAVAETVRATGETSTVVENELYRITFTNRGGQVSSWILKKYTNNEGKPLDLVHQGAAAHFGLPMSLYTYDAALNKTLTQGLYVASATGTLQAPASVSFNYASGNIAVRKTFTFGSDYVIHADTELLRDGFPIRSLLAWPSGFGDMETVQAYGSAQVDSSVAGKDSHEAFKDVSNGATSDAAYDFAGVSDQYFATIFMPDKPADATVVNFYNQLQVKDQKSGTASTPEDFKVVSSNPADKLEKGYSRVPLLGSAVGDVSGHNLARVFVGPKALPVLKSVKTVDGNTLGPILDFGFWGPVGKGLYLGLHFVQEHISSNWGWAIVLFTIAINLILLPLRVQGMKSMLKMQRIQPQIDLIKARYKNPKPTDPKAAEMNAEVMAYQKEQGVSMFGGCVPTLIQLPLLFAFFTMMTRVVELRHAHWLWIGDLSQSDPWKVLPIVMFVTSFLVQRYTPSPGVDPAQQKMMAYMMPAFSLYMTWNYASALALYWNVGNFIMILQQQVMNQTPLGREIKELQARRALGKTAGPKIIQGKR